MRNTPNFGDEAARLPDSMDDLLGLSYHITHQQRETAPEWFAPMLLVTSPLSPSITDTASRAKNSTTLNQRSALKFSIEETSTIVDACKRQSYSVTSAWHAALALAFYKHRSRRESSTSMELPVDQNQGLATFTTVDMRRFFPSSFDPRESAMACYHTALPVVLPIQPGLDPEKEGDLNLIFAGMAAKMQKFFAFGKTFKDGSNITQERSKAWPPYIEMMRDAILSCDETQSAPLLSSFGLLENFIHRSFGDIGCDKPEIEIIDVWLGDTMTSATSFWSVQTWRDRLEISVTYNEGYFAKREMVHILEHIRAILLSSVSFRE
ncbi:hypothetical protein NQ176_g5374 [Zarea fungicola]|uniref:Uncharacterized protein n=1 Tax=Zarea fungicola TaxID=93591 RepID=A0ACC1N9E4_9HYPO|nr:hypothetical protein NQ176_g5374 [Lecanicillium fungicola]